MLAMHSHLTVIKLCTSRMQEATKGRCIGDNENISCCTYSCGVY